MSLEAMLAAHDDAALEALVSKGLVRRARRDFDAGLAVVSTRGKAGATVLADGQTVHIEARALSAARCTCPADGICRHVLLAVMALRAQAVDAALAPADATAADATKDATAVGQICALSEAELMKLAGRDWAAAVALAAASASAVISESGRNCSVELSGAAVSVTFIAGQNLKNAAYKGPKTRARIAVAAAAVLVRAKQGVAVEAAVEAASDDARLTADFLDAAADVLTRATRIVMAGSSAIAADVLFDLAVSARVEAAPRLTSQLRSLSRHASLAAVHDINFDPDRFLAEAARAAALIEALKSDPANPLLTGSLRRDYRPAAAFDLWLIGASSWRSEASARGVTFFGYAPQEKRWHSAAVARAAGQDPTFDPRIAYGLPLWNAGQPAKLMGHALHLPDPLVANDGSIALTLPRPATITTPIGSVRALIEAGAAHPSWTSLRRDLGSRFGGGLKRRAQPAPALLAPAKYGGFAFDELAQVYEWEVIDQSGDRLVLTIPASAELLAQRLRREAPRFRLILAEASVGQVRLVFRPITLIAEKAGTLEVVNLDLDEWLRPRDLRSAFESAQELFAKPSAPTAPPHDPLRDLASRALDAAAAVAANAKPADLDALTSACESAGLLSLANALESMAQSRSIAHALRTAYLASEVRTALILQ